MNTLLATMLFVCTCNANTQHEYRVVIPDYGCAAERDAPRFLKQGIKEGYESDRYLTPRERKQETREELRRCSCEWREER